MNICFLCNEYPPGTHGGIGSFTQTLGRALAARGHSVTACGLYGIDRAREEDDCGVRVIRIPHNPRRGLGYFINGRRLVEKLKELNRTRQFDVIDGPEISLAALPPDLGTARIIRMNGGHHFFMVTLGRRPLRLRGWLEKRSFTRASHLCAVSRFVAETTRQLLKLDQRPIEILPNPVDTERFRPRPEIAPVPGLIVFAGTVNEKKGVRHLLQAMPEIFQAVPTARLQLIGRDGLDPVTGASYTAAMRTLLQDLLPAQQRERIEFVGRLDNAHLPETLARAEVCVYPSHMEAQGIVVIEGMAMGRAVVASRTGPGPELIDHGVSGLLCDPHDSHSIAQQIIRALTNEALRAQLGAAARRRAAERFSLAALTAGNELFYERCLRQV